VTVLTVALLLPFQDATATTIKSPLETALGNDTAWLVTVLPV
jgi:hypothetical protein